MKLHDLFNDTLHRDSNDDWTKTWTEKKIVVKLKVLEDVRRKTAK